MPPPPIRNITPSDYRFPREALGTWMVRGVIVVVLLWLLSTSFTQVPADSVGVILRFGKYVETVKPGLQFRLPFGIDQVAVVPVLRQLKLEFGFATQGATNPDQAAGDVEEQRTMVTGDLNMALVEWVVQYHIADPKQYLFHVNNPGETLRDASESAVREVVGDRLVDEVLTVGRQDVEDQSLVRLKALAVEYGLGISVNQVQLKDVHPPRPVQASFNEVNEAQQEREKAINNANGEYNKAVPRAKGLADQKVTEAEGYALRRVNEARGDADKFTSQLTEYLKAPEITRQRIYLETIGEVLPQLSRKIIIDEKAGQLLPLLPLDLGKTALPPR
ncbi:MAG TPA: FtsH protease activity modulator HflK [Chthoniobacteraceae bacterium]|jgi:membrane protease subunit HflK|nr:FtsH protease activity modulator HflK [Chthoniobacteraceae bacterium]